MEDPHGLGAGCTARRTRPDVCGHHSMPRTCQTEPSTCITWQRDNVIQYNTNRLETSYIRLCRDKKLSPPSVVILAKDNTASVPRYSSKRWSLVNLESRTSNSSIGMPVVPAFQSPRSATQAREALIVSHTRPQAPQKRHNRPPPLCTPISTPQQECPPLDCTNAVDRFWTHHVLPAFTVFSHVYGHSNVKPTFVVPKGRPWTQETWGLPLGAIVQRLRAGQSYVEQSTRDQKVLETLGFLWHARDVEWHERVLPALVTFADEWPDAQELTANFIVPAAPPWPKPTWGLELGLFWTHAPWRERYFVQLVRDATLLQTLGFQVHLSQATWDHHVVPLVCLYASLCPHARTVPPAFVIPYCNPWPRNVWGLPLGQLGALNATRLALETREWTRQVATPPSEATAVTTPSLQWKRHMVAAFATFVRVFDHCQIHRHFVIPRAAPWPRETWGLRLGARVAAYVTTGCAFAYIGQVADRLHALGYALELSRPIWHQYGAPLMATFALLHPQEHVPQPFVVPSTAPWAESMWGVQLGVLVQWNRSSVTHLERKWRRHVLAAATMYDQEAGDPGPFVVPSHPPWPILTWKTPLARIVQRVTTGEFYDGHVAFARHARARVHQLLDEERHTAWETILGALERFATHYQHCHVQPHFTVPASPPWPPRMWHLPLGSLVAMMETQGLFASEMSPAAARLTHLHFAVSLSPSAYDTLLVPLVASFARHAPRATIPSFSADQQGFVIPPEAPWPRDQWTWNLSLLVQWNRSRCDAIERTWRAHVLRANDVYQYEHGNTILRDSFRVPCRAPWPFTTWGRSLRRMLTSVQVGEPYGGHVAMATDRANEAVVVASDKHRDWQTTIFPALHTFATIRGHGAIPPTFTVPRRSPWPKQTHGVALGHVVATMATTGAFYAEVGLNADRLETLGFRYQLTDGPWHTHVTPLLDLYATHAAHAMVPEDFVVPPRAPWPSHLYGFRLGKIVKWSARFIFEDSQWRAVAMPENTTQAGAYGYFQVAPSFVIPSQRPWPPALWKVRVEDLVAHLHGTGLLFLLKTLPGGRTREKAMGFVVKLASTHKPVPASLSRRYMATVDQLDGPAAWVEPVTWLGKRAFATDTKEAQDE